MEIFLVRHGNTFENNQTPVWLGCNQDLPLTNFGKKQADLVSSYFKATKINQVISAPLKRTKEAGKIISEKLGLDLTIDDRLSEIDFGTWGGLSDKEVEEKYGRKELQNWVKLGKFPENCDWEPSPQVLKKQAREITSSLSGKKTILVSSQVRIRYFLSLIPNELEKRLSAGTFKVSPGSISKISKIHNNWNLDFWNYKPNETT